MKNLDPSMKFIPWTCAAEIRVYLNTLIELHREKAGLGSAPLLGSGKSGRGFHCCSKA